MRPKAAADARPSRFFARAAALAGVSLLASLFVAFGIHGFTGAAIRDHPADLGLVETLVGLTAAPIIENLLLIFVLEVGVAARITDRRVLPVIAAVPLAVFHGVFAPAWGIAIFPAFVVYAHAYDYYRRAGQARTGYWSSVLVHAMHNGAALALIAGT